MARCKDEPVSIGPRSLAGSLARTEPCRRLVVFAHGSGSSRLSPRNVQVARALNARGFATLLFDLLTEREAADRANVFDIDLLGARVIDAIDWCRLQAGLSSLSIGLFGASTGAAAALFAAAARPADVNAVVSRGGRPDLARASLARVRAPTLLIVGGADEDVLHLNSEALAAMSCTKRLALVRGATHLFEEPGALEEVVALASDWLEKYVA